MAQVLKEEIREHILNAAIREFFEKGYQAATMRRIADGAGIPTGLIYSYYVNKEALFDAVLSPVMYDWHQVMAEEDEGHNRQVVHGISMVEANCLRNLFEHRQQFIILMDKSEGTKYEQEKDRLIQEIEIHMEKHRKDDTVDPVFVHIVANNFLDGVMQIMYHYKGEEWAMEVIHKLSAMYLWGIGF